MNSLFWVFLTLALADPEPEAQEVQGGQGYNPGASGVQGYNPGGGGGQGYYPGGEGGQGYNPGASGGQGYNPGGQPYLPLEPSQSGFSSLYPLNPSQHPGGPNSQPLDPVQQGGSSGMFNPNARALGPSTGQPGQYGMVDECCGMAQQGCCVEGQQCYTYYTQECESVDAPVCNKRLRNLCHEATVPDCQVRRNPGSLMLTQLVCVPVARTEMFTYNVTVCDRSQTTTKYKVVTWENEELKEVNSTFNQEVKNITTCEFSYVNKTVVENVPKVELMDPEVVERRECRRVPETSYRTELRVTQQISYVPECQTVQQQVCSQSPCQQSGCTDGGSICSATEQQPVPQTICAQGQGATTSACQQVPQPVCYGQNQPCSIGSGQQCCSQAPQQVCRQVPRRVPVWRNVTVPNVTRKEECRTVNQTLPPRQKTIYVKQNVTKSHRICNKVYKEETFNYTMPKYEVIKTNRSEKVPFVVAECKLRQETKQYYHTFPNADIKCTNKTVRRQYILNKVVCDRQRPVKFCRGIPESDCRNATNQRCRMVPKQVCQPGCSSSQTCNQCDTFSKQGGFSSCPSQTCPNYYPTTTVGGQGGQGYYPGGEGGQGYYPGGQGDGGQGYYPGGQGEGGQGYYPGGQGYYPGGQGDGGQGYNPGGQGFYPDALGGQGYNPGIPRTKIGLTQDLLKDEADPEEDLGL